MTTYGGRLPEGQADGGTEATGNGRVAVGGVVDLSGFSLRDLRDMRDADGRSYLSMALTRVLAPGEPPGLHGFSSKI